LQSQPEREAAYALINIFGPAAAKLARENANYEMCVCNEDQAAYWRRVTALIVDLSMRFPAADHLPGLS
jgi:hypothetical protein